MQVASFSQERVYFIRNGSKGTVYYGSYGSIEHEVIDEFIVDSGHYFLIQAI